VTARTAPGDRATVTVTVDVPQDAAFEVFTREIDLWWKRGPAYRQILRGGVVRLEPGVGGRVFEADDAGQVFERGHVTLWAPPQRLVIEWRGAAFAPGEKTAVDVLFEPTASGGTRVTVVHSGWSSLRPDHPARHGLVGAPMSRMIGQWWGALMTAMRMHASGHE
jgi:uncharacterized protein YndB with AHSA1/START domain